MPKSGICFLKRVTSTVMSGARKMALFNDDLGEEMHRNSVEALARESLG